MTRILLDRPDAVLVGDRTGEGSGVLLLHAGGERRQVWRPITRLLAANGYRCLAYDLRGHGESGTAGADEVFTHAADVAAMITEEPTPVTVVGASLGGIATVLALARPGVGSGVAAVVLVDVVPRLDPDRVRTFLNQVRDGYGERPLVRDVLEHRARLEAATGGLTAVPTLLVRGERSALTDRDRDWFTEQVPHAAVATVAGAGHLVARDAPARLGHLLLEQLDSWVPRSAHA